MPSESAKAALRDIAHHIDLAVEFAAACRDADTFAADLRAVYAVTRCLEIISEASRTESATPIRPMERHRRRGQRLPARL
jgi:uncharacterized protein with HEPN domain